MKWIAQHKTQLVILLLISIVYFVLRVPNLTLQPIFADEAIYIRWAQVMKAEPTLRFLPLSDGKTPLFMWAMIPFFKIFEDPLFAGRLLSVSSGYLTLLGVLFIGWRFFNPKVGLWSALFITVTPYIVFFDRMALVDSMLSAFSIWCLGLGMVLIQLPRLDLAMILGYLIGGGLLTKPSGIFNLINLPILLIGFNFVSSTRWQRFFRIVILGVVTIIIATVIYNILRLGPGFSTMNSRSQDYIFTPYEIKDRLWDPFIPHLRDMAEWFPKFLTIPQTMLVILGLILPLIYRNKFILTVLAWVILPLIVQMMFLRTFTTRYILFSIPPLLLLAAWSWDYLLTRFKVNNLKFLVLGLLTMTPLSLYFDYLLVTKPEVANLPYESKVGYFEQWTAGYGLKETAQYLMDQAKKGSIVVGTEGGFGTLPDGLQIYLDRYHHLSDKEHQISIKPGKGFVVDELFQDAKLHPTYFIANGVKSDVTPTGLTLILQFTKVKGIGPLETLTLYQLRSGN